MKYVLMMIGFILLAGCSQIQTAVRHAKPLTDEYCMQPLEIRLQIRSQVNAAIAPNAIKVQCAGDPE